MKIHLATILTIAFGTQTAFAWWGDQAATSSNVSYAMKVETIVPEKLGSSHHSYRSGALKKDKAIAQIRKALTEASTEEPNLWPDPSKMNNDQLRTFASRFEVAGEATACSAWNNKAFRLIVQYASPKNLGTKPIDGSEALRLQQTCVPKSAEERMPAAKASR